MIWKYRQELAEIADEIERGNLYSFEEVFDQEDSMDTEVQSANEDAKKKDALIKKIRQRGSSVFWLEEKDDDLIDFKTK